MRFIVLNVKLFAPLVALAVLSGCPDDVSPIAELSPTPSSEASDFASLAPTPGPTMSSPVSTPKDDDADETPTPAANDDIIWTDPINWANSRLHARRFYQDDDEFTPMRAPRPAPYVQTHKALKAFQAGPLFKLFATNMQRHEAGSNQGNDALNALTRLLQGLFHSHQGDFDLAKLLVTVNSVEVRRQSDGLWQTVKDFGSTGHEFDFVALHDGGILEIGAFEMAPGTYNKMRLNLGRSNRVVVDEGHGDVERPLVVPFFASRQIELVHAFDVTSAGLTSVRVDFDLDKSVSKGLFHTYWLTPVMKILGVETGTPSSRMIQAATGGVVEIMNEIAVVIPPDALATNTQVTVRPAYELFPHQTPNLLIMGQEYIIEPEGLILSAPAEVVLTFRRDHANALSLNDASLDLFMRPPTSSIWLATGGGILSDQTKVHGQISEFARLTVGGEPDDAAMNSGEGCRDYGAETALVPTNLGIDPQLFHSSCDRLALCYEHGGKTYGLTAEQCLDEMFETMTVRCEQLCQSGFGLGCHQLSPDDLASVLAQDLVKPLYDHCLVVAGRMLQTRTAAKSTEHPAIDAQHCADYQGIGVSCATPTCSLSVDESLVEKNKASDLRFSLTWTGSVERVSFDNSPIMEQTAPALSSSGSVEIVDEGRMLSAAKTFVATVSGPADQIGQCSVTVDVFEVPDPCTIVITPNLSTPGTMVNIFITVLPGYNAAFLDLRTQGVMNAIGLSAPDEAGTRYFSTNSRPSGTRTYTARVVHDDGTDYVCSEAVTVQ